MQTNLPSQNPVTALSVAPPCLESVISRRTSDIHLHPALARLRIQPAMQEISRLSGNVQCTFEEPLIVTRSGIILDGHAPWWLARQRGREWLPCLERDLTDEEALLHLLSNQRRSEVLNDFTRILLALELEPWLQQQARSNRQTGGQLKGSSNLTEAARVDVRTRIASAASVSAGNVSKTKELLKQAHPDVVAALRDGEIRIHRAWVWCQDLGDGSEGLRLFQSRRGIRTHISALADKQRPKDHPSSIGLRKLRSALNQLMKDPRLSRLAGECEDLIEKLAGHLEGAQHARS